MLPAPGGCGFSALAFAGKTCEDISDFSVRVALVALAGTLPLAIGIFASSSLAARCLTGHLSPQQAIPGGRVVRG